ncbi:MAG TPA: 2-oxo-4-hydroxy-4-carboxy-5-ureidoimidazoline decarboxylase [Candidatus Sulfopaludibacter sp.]|nr:2-oxo-4-hydroxy-4-carboxy-5-ureidoimidazoline decarboxylase [Candidatus Sulfopaludibacter sp.]
MTLAEIDSLAREQFVDALGFVYENSPWVAERAWAHRPFSSFEDLYAAMAAEVERAGVEEQVALLQAHPDLGARARMSDLSAGEQAGAGLDRLTAEELETLRAWNDEYRRRFGFPFLFAVKGATKHDILKALEQRLEAPRDEEFREGLRQVYRIAWFRLEALVEPEKGGR